MTATEMNGERVMKGREWAAWGHTLVRVALSCQQEKVLVLQDRTRS